MIRPARPSLAEVPLAVLSFILQPTVRRTWAPHGQMPILKSYDRHDQLTAVSAVTVSPQRRRLGLVFDLLDHNLATEDFELFVERLLRKIRGPITMVIDRLGAHKSAAKRLLVKYPARLGFEWLPPYSPDLNPTAHVWGHTKTAAWPTSFPTIFFISAGPSPTLSERPGASSGCSVPSSVRLNSTCRSLEEIFKAQEGRL